MGAVVNDLRRLQIELLATRDERDRAMGRAAALLDANAALRRDVADVTAQLAGETDARHRAEQACADLREVCRDLGEELADRTVRKAVKVAPDELL